MSGSSLNTATVKLVEELLLGGAPFFEGLVRKLQAVYPGVAEEATAAVAHAVEKTIVRPATPEDVSKYLTAVSYNEMKRLGRQRQRQGSLDVLRNDAGEFPADPNAVSVEETALRQETYKELKRHVESWESGSVRVVTLLYLEAAFEGTPLSSEEAAEIVAGLLGHEVDADFVRTWKSRGFKRLRKFVEALETEGER